MATFYTIDRANARLPELREVVEQLRGQREQLVKLRDEMALARADGEQDDDTVRLLDARIRALVDQMHAAVVRIDGWGITLREIQTGLVDFPALVSGRQVWLCWRLGEDDVGWWHELDSGFSGRRRIADMA